MYRLFVHIMIMELDLFIYDISVSVYNYKLTISEIIFVYYVLRVGKTFREKKINQIEI